MRKLTNIIILFFLFVPTSAFAQWPYDNKPMLGQQINWAHPLSDFVGFWLFNEGSGNKVFDLSGNGNTGTFGAGAASPIWTSGKSGSALAFASDYITLSSTGSLKQASQSGLTVIYAITMGSVNSYDMVISGGKWDDSWCFTHNNNTTFPRINAFNRQINCSVDFGTGYYVLAATANAIRFDWYKNGVWVAESIGAGTWEMDSEIAMIGASISQYILSDAILHWVFVYDRVLTASEVALQYQEHFCMFAEDDVALMAEGAAPAPTGGQVIMITSLPLLFMAIYLRKWRKL